MHAKAGSPSADETPLSLRRLRNAFAAMLSPGSQAPTEKPRTDRQAFQTKAPADPCEISPSSLVEAMLFVGRPDDGPMSSRELAATLRGISPAEVDAAVVQLNTRYEQDAAPYRIEGAARGYRIALRGEFGRVRDKFLVRMREAKLAPAALEVLALVAYNQPIAGEKVNELLGRPSGAILANLVRKQLLQLERQSGGAATYQTTERFLRLFRLDSLTTLPRNEELETSENTMPPQLGAARS